MAPAGLSCGWCGLSVRENLARCPRCGAGVGAAVVGEPLGALAGLSGRLGAVEDRTVARLSLAELVAPRREPPQMARVVTGGQSETLANLGSRLSALLLDGLVLAAAYFLFMLLVGLASAGVALLPAVFAQTIGITGQVLAAIGLSTYLVVLNGRGQTLGKKAVGIAVVDRNTGGAIGFQRALVRYLMLVVMGLPCYLGYLSIPLSAQLRGWHDQAADDLVVVLPPRG